MAKLEPGFAVPFGFAEHPDPERLNAALRELFLAREHDGQRYANPSPLVDRNDALYESRFDLFEWPDRPITELRNFCWRELYGLIAQLNGFDRTTLARLHIGNSCWFHITRNGGYFGIHNHAMATWSGVYCVDPGERVESSKDSGQLTFLSPQLAASMFVDRSVVGMQNPYTLGKRSFQLTAGQLILFPSWLLHEVKPYLGQRERITVAFNCWFKYDEA